MTSIPAYFIFLYDFYYLGTHFSAFHHGRRVPTITTNKQTQQSQEYQLHYIHRPDRISLEFKQAAQNTKHTL